MRTVLQLNASASDGGAARAASRLHLALEGHGTGWQSTFRAIQGSSKAGSYVVGPPRGQSAIRRRLRPRLAQFRRRGWTPQNPSLHSLAWLDTSLGEELMVAYSEGRFQLLNMHWLGDCTLSIEEIGKFKFPIVWTLHDQWAFSGAEHYSPLPFEGETVISKQRFAHAYSVKTCPNAERKCDLNRSTWLRKKRSWLRPITIVCPSRWMETCVQSSALMADWPSRVIPNPIDLQRWFPVRPALARELLGLPVQGSLVLFGAMGGGKDPRKGCDLLINALQKLIAEMGCSDESPRLAIFGEERPLNPPVFGVPVHYLGHLYDDLSLRLAYSAADVMVIPSRLDNLPNTATEAMSCGTPVVAFRTGGLPDIIDDHVNGRLAEPFDSFALSECIKYVLKSSIQNPSMALAARRAAESKWDLDRVAKMYKDLYDEVLERSSLCSCT